MATMKNSSSSGRKMSLFSHVKYEHLVAGISGGVTSTLILHPLDLIKIRFAGECRCLFETFFNRLLIVCFHSVCLGNELMLESVGAEGALI